MLPYTIGGRICEFLARPCPAPVVTAELALRDPGANDWPVETDASEILAHLRRRLPDMTRQHVAVALSKLIKNNLVDRIGTGRYQLSHGGVIAYRNHVELEREKAARMQTLAPEICATLLRAQLDELYDRNKRDGLPLDHYRVPNDIDKPWTLLRRETGVSLAELRDVADWASRRDWIFAIPGSNTMRLHEKGEMVGYAMVYLRRGHVAYHHAAEVASFYPTASNRHDIRNDINAALKIPEFEALAGAALREEVAGDPNFVTESLNHPVH